MQDDLSDKMQSIATGPKGAITDKMAEDAVRMVQYGDVNYQRAVYNALNRHGKYAYAEKIIKEYGDFELKVYAPANCNEAIN